MAQLPTRCKDLTGRKFGNLTAIEYVGAKKHSYNAIWRFQCDCGETVECVGTQVTRGIKTTCKTCGKKRGDAKVTRHGLWNHPVYGLWRRMIQRCYNPRNASYAWYGGRGISVCDEWQRRPDEFMQWALSHGYTKGLSLDRIDIDGNYCPENCRIATPKEQANNRSNNTFVEARGEMLTAKQLSERYEIPYSSVLYRIKCGWPVERIISEPLHSHDKTYLVYGEMLTTVEGEEIYGVPRKTIWGRLNRGWEPEAAFTTPTKKGADS